MLNKQEYTREMTNRRKTLFSLLLTVILAAGSVLITGSAQPDPAGENEISDSLVEIQRSSDDGLLKYREYADAYAGFGYPEGNVVLDGADYTEQDGSDAQVCQEYEGAENVLLWKNGKGSVTWTFEIPEDGLYSMKLNFLPLKSGNEVEFKLYIDGIVPFDGAAAVKLSRDWVNATEEPRVDKEGNELAPEQVETGRYIERMLTDDTGVVLEPYQFGFTAGTHTVTLEGVGYPIAVSKLQFVAPEQTEDYEVLSKGYRIEEDGSVEPIRIHGEAAATKTSSSLIPKAGNGDAGLYPVHEYLSKLNYIGGSAWNSPGQSISWTFQVEKAGYYQFGARYKQNELVNGESIRWLKIDGKTPFDEAKTLRFPYATKWQYYEFADEGAPYYIWLEEGEHTLSLETTLGEMADVYARMNESVAALGDLYLDIIMITSETPDVDRDYELFRQIPDFNETLTSIYDDLDLLVKDINGTSGEQGSEYTAAINNMKRVIQKMVDAPYIAHTYVKDYYTNYTTLCSWLTDMKKMPLALDEMQFVYAGQEFDWDQPNLAQRMWYGIKRLWYSFVQDNGTAGDEEEAELTIWVNWGRDQASALDSLIRESFTAETGIKVNIKITANSLINGLLSDDYPDLMLQLSRTDPVNYGMRGALLDLTQFDDYEEVLGRFQEGADIPYWYQEELYALPDTQTFYIMFYRTDVFEELGLEIPTTWEEFLYCATVIRRHNMNVYLPYTQITTSTTVNAGIGSLNLYPTLMMQNGLSLYNEELNATALDDPEAIQVFDAWTELYTDYGFLREADFYNRFRNGSMPLGIAPYSTYLTLYSAAPEIYGRWSMANVPGAEDGNSYVAGGGTGCSIVKATEHPREAWEFLKWWTSADTQTRYCNNVESILGVLGRTATSNVEAFSRFSWNPRDLEELLAQWENVREEPEVPGSYYLTRAVDQAFWAVLNDKGNPKDAIIKWSEVADGEITRKIEEYQ